MIMCIGIYLTELPATCPTKYTSKQIKMKTKILMRLRAAPRFFRRYPFLVVLCKFNIEIVINS